MLVQERELEKYIAIRTAGVDWLLRQLNDDGSLGDPREGYNFYRAPWTFAAAGHTEAASAVCGWIRQHMLTGNGTIEGPYRVFDDAWAYRDSALIVGAQMAQQYDLSHGLIPVLERWQDDRSSGSSNDRMPDGSMSDDMSIPYSAGPGYAFLATGHLDRARAVYEFLDRLYAAQPELPHRFYYVWSRSRQQVVTEFDPAEKFWYLVDNRIAETQRWTIGGIAAGFLGRLYLTDPRPEYLALARQYQAFSMNSTEEQFRFAQVCKSGWGSSVLYQITGEDQYLAWTRRMGDWFAAGQAPEGYWPPAGDGGVEDAAGLGRIIHNALEFAMHVDHIIGGLASRPGLAVPAAQTG
jgi:hypothetical protein